MLDGFYVGYMTGKGYGVVLFVFRGNTIVGVDAGGVKFDGKYTFNSENSLYSGEVTVSAPPNSELVQGIQTGPAGITYKVPFSMPENFLNEPYIKVETPFGSVNVRLEKLRDLDSIT